VPELPEVEVVRAGLERHVVGALIEAVEVLHPRPVRRDHRGSTGFVAALVGRRIEAVRRRGKYFWIALDNGDRLTLVVNSVRIDAQDPLGLTADQYALAPRLAPLAVQYDTRKTVEQTQAGLLYERRLSQTQQLRLMVYGG